jgi:hypothetical protein
MTFLEVFVAITSYGKNVLIVIGESLFKQHFNINIILISSLILPAMSYSQDDGLAAWWKFDSLDKQEIINPLTRKGKPTPEIERKFSVIDEISGTKDQVIGSFFQLVTGVSGSAILLDGNTSFIRRSGENSLKLSGDFSVDAWIALGAYPTNWCPIVDHNSESNRGWFLGVDAQGQPGFKVKTGEEWSEVFSDYKIPLREWTHIAGVYSTKNGITLYLNGNAVSTLKVNKSFVPEDNAQLLIGKYSIKRRPEGTIRPKGTAPVYTFFDGLIDETRIYDRALNEIEILDYYRHLKPQINPQLAIRTLPAGKPGKGKFSAVYTTLRYYPAWDALWPVGDKADVVVKFDEFDGRLVFWRGTSYVPHWVTENGIWYNNEFAETWSSSGGHEPMSDKRCEFSHVRIIENNNARVMVHWRYALVDNWYGIAKIDSLSGFGEWVDEVFTIYPDGVAVREITLYSIQPQSPHEWHEGIVVMGPGQRPEQVLEPGALTLANMDGETYTFTWENGIPKERGEMGLVHVLDKANIHMINTRSEFRPFVIVSPESNPDWEIFSNNELRPEVSMFPWWNHWPTAQKGSDGRFAQDSDLASHTSLSNCHWDAYRITNKSLTKIMLNGLTDKTAEYLVPLAASWSYPPVLEIKRGKGFDNLGYDPATRAYLINYAQEDIPGRIVLKLGASNKSPVVNPAFVIKNYQVSDVDLSINGKKMKKKNNFRIGLTDTFEGSDLIVWIKLETIQPVTIAIQPKN